MPNHRNRVSLPCETCGVMVERKVSAVRGRVFCSWACSRARNAKPVSLSEDGLTARVPLLSRDGSVLAYALIDAADAEWAGQWQWGLSKQGQYAVRGNGIKMHRELLGLTRGDGLFGDHINRDKLDNRRGNLRILTPSESAQNVSSRSHSSKYRGVIWDDRRGLWWAVAHVGRRRVYSEFFVEEEEAAEAARAARERYLPFATN